MSKEQFNPKDKAKIQKERDLSNAELIKGGADYVVDEKSEKPRLEVTAAQNLEREMEMKYGKDRRERIKTVVNELGIADGDEIVIFIDQGSEKVWEKKCIFRLLGVEKIIINEKWPSGVVSEGAVFYNSIISIGLPSNEIKN